MATVKKVTVNLQAPGELPEKVSVKQGTTLAELAQNRNLEGYTISLNGNTVEANDKTVLKSKDVIRIGIRTKNN